MSVTLDRGCQGVCGIVTERLRNMGVLTPQDIRHQPIFDGLDKVAFVLKTDLAELLAVLIGDKVLPSEQVEELRKRYTEQRN